MPLRIITGRAGSGKTRLCIDEIKDRLGGVGEGMLFYLVPEQSNLDAEHALFNACGRDGFINAAVLTFRRISHRVFRELGQANRQYINNIGKRLCLSSIVEENRESLEYYRYQSRTAGFIDEAASIFSEFKQNKLSAGALSAASETLLTNPALAAKLRELSFLYKLYNDRIGADYLDTDDDLTVLASIIGDSETIRGAEFWIDGFSGFTEQEYDVISGLMQYAKNVTVCLNAEIGVSVETGASGVASIVVGARMGARSGAARSHVEKLGDRAGVHSGASSLFTPVVDTMAELENRAAAIGVTVEKRHLTRPGSTKFMAPELLYIEKHLFGSYPGAYKDVNSAVNVRECADSYDETEYAAASIRALCRERHYRFSDVAVICADIEAYAPMIKPVFERHGLRCFIDDKHDISDHPLIRLILSLFSILESGFAYEHVFAYLKTGLTDITLREADKLENFALAHGIKGSLWNEARIWRGGDTGRIRNINNIRERFMRPILLFEGAVKGNTGPEAFGAAIYNFLENCGAMRKLGEILSGGDRSPTEMSKISEWKQIWDFIADILSQINTLMGGSGNVHSKNSIAAYAGMFRSGAESFKIGAIPPSADEILIGSLNRTRSRKVKALFILGAGEGAFPGMPKPPSLLSDDNRAALRNAGVKVAPDTISASYDVQFQAYRTLTAATDFLCITWPSTSGGVSNQKPSYLVKRITRMFPATAQEPDSEFILNTGYIGGTVEKLLLKLGEPGAISGKIGGMTGITIGGATGWTTGGAAGGTTGGAAGGTTGGAAGGTNIVISDKKWAAAMDWLQNGANYPDLLSAYLSSAGYRASDINAPNLSANAGGGGVNEMSVSRLERYAACPFSYLSEYLVKARQRREYKLEAPDIGSFVHRAIEMTASDLLDADNWADIAFGDCADRAGAAVEALLDEDSGSAFSASQRNMYHKGRIKDMVAWGVYAAAKHIEAGAYRPWKHEMRFSGEAGEHADIRIKGIIDRVDVAHRGDKTYVRVIDYKTGRRKLTMSDIVSGLSIQLPIYLDAAVKAVAEDEKNDAEPQPGGLLYFELQRPLINARKDGRAAHADDGLPKDEGLLELMAMNGYIIGDENDYSETYENDISNNYKSKIIKGVALKRDNTFTAKVFAPTPDEYSLIMRAVEAGINGISSDMARGVYNVSPYKKSGRSACTYCPYAGACGIDVMRRDASYRIIPNTGDKTVLNSLKGDI